MTRRARLVLGLLCLAAANAAAKDGDLSREDFAYGRAIELTQAAPLQSVLLDQRVYRGSVESQFADVRVFNGAGDTVPHAIRPLDTSKPVRGGRVLVPLFRLPAAPAAGPASRDAATAADERTYRIEAEVSADGAIVSITSPGTGNQQAANAIPTAYLLDASQIERDLVGLDLELGEATADFLAPLRVEASEDLVRFRPIVAGAALARLEQSGHRIEISDVEIAKGRYRYLRLSWPETNPAVEILGAHARLAPSIEARAREQVRVDGAPLAGDEQAFVFDLGGSMPVDQIQVDLPDANTLVEARLFSAPSQTGPWTVHYSGLLFDLAGPTPLRNAAIDWPTNRHRYVKLATSAKGGGIGSGTPRLEASWYPEQLLFITRGAPPYWLAYGRAGTSGSRFDAGQLLLTVDAAQDGVPRATAALGEEHTVAASSVLDPAEKPIAARTVALWAVLLLSVVVALALGIRLSRQMRGEA